MMATLDPLFKPQTHQQENQIIRRNILVTCAAQDQRKNLFQLAHAYSVIPASFATVLMSLSPRPERLIRMI